MYENSTEMIEKWTDIFEISSNKYCNFGYIRKNCPSKISSGLQFKIEGVLHPSQLAQSVFFFAQVQLSTIWALFWTLSNIWALKTEHFI